MKAELNRLRIIVGFSLIYQLAIGAPAPAETPSPDVLNQPLVDASLISVRPVTRGPKFHWFGYYDKFETDPSGRYLLAHEVDFEHRTPRSDDVIKIGMVDLAEGDKWIELAESRAWSWQQGSMLQWRPGSATEIVFNDREGDHYVCRILDVKTRQMRTLPMAIDTLTADGKYALGCDYARVQHMRAGYGYAGVEDPSRNIAAPDTSGVFKMDMETGKTELLLSIATLAKIPYPERGPNDRHYVNHVQLNPDETRFFVFDRWIGGRPGQWTRVFTANFSDGGDIRLLVASGGSHYVWDDNRTTLIWASGSYNFYVDDGTGLPKKTLWSAPNGHHSFIPGTNREWIITDTYPEKEKSQAVVYLFHCPTGRTFILGRFDHPPDYRGEWRCDSHPRVSRDGGRIFIDSPHGGNGRQIYAIDISRVIAAASKAESR